jgi:hypothetical protein
MAQKVVVEMVDDIDGGPANHTVQFGLDGVDYVIDLSDAHADDLRAELASYLAAAHRTGGRKVRGTGRAPAATSARQRTWEIRAWALANGHEVSTRGRISSELAELFDTSRALPEPEAVTVPRKRTQRKKAARS